MSEFDLSAKFIGSSGERLLVVSHRPRTVCRKGVLLVAPFGEELNKSRRMLNLAAQQIASRGMCAVLPDLYGTGDSDGEFYQADWLRWKRDLLLVSSSAEEEGVSLVAALAVRTGCALLAETAQESAFRLSHTVFWQPVLEGARFLTQFLRLRAAATLMEEDRRESVGELRTRLRAGEAIEVAGYLLSPAMADQLEKVKLFPGAELGSIRWIDIVRDEHYQMSEAAQSLVRSAHSGKAAVETSFVLGDPFWSSTEIVENPALVEQTVASLTGAA